MAELEQPNIVGNYLSNYYAAQQQKQAGEDRQRNMQRQDRQDQMAETQFSGQQDLQKLETAMKRGQAMAQIIGSVRDGDVQGFETAKQRAVQELGLSPEQVANLTIADLPRLRDQSGQTMRELEVQYKRAQIGTEQAQGRAANALAQQRQAMPGGGAGGIDNTTFDNMSGLRREFTQATKTYGDVRDAYGRIEASAKNPSAAGDLSLIFNYMKVLDPGSTVREGEFATAQNATGIPERVVNAYNNAISGQRLNPEQRNDFVKRAGLLYNRQHQTYLSTKKNYDTLAQRFGFDPSLVTFDQSGGITGPQEQSPPQSAPQSFIRGQGVFTDQPVQQAPAANGGWSIKRVQ